MNLTISCLERSFSDSDLHNNSVPSVNKATSITKFLITPKKVTRGGKLSAGKVLTSLENLRMLEEKERLKMEALDEKVKHKELREAKKAQKKLPKKRHHKTKGIGTIIIIM